MNGQTSVLQLHCRLIFPLRNGWLSSIPSNLYCFSILRLDLLRSDWILISAIEQYCFVAHACHGLLHLKFDLFVIQSVSPLTMPVTIEPVDSVAVVEQVDFSLSRTLSLM
jgi:hypothetical protein